MLRGFGRRQWPRSRKRRSPDDASHLRKGFGARSNQRGIYRLISQATDNTVLQVIIEALTDIVLQQVEQSNIEFFPNLIAHRRRLVEYIATRQVDEASGK